MIDLPGSTSDIGFLETHRNALDSAPMATYLRELSF